MQAMIDLPEEMLAHLAAEASARGTTVDELIRSAVEQALTKVESTPGRRLRFPLLPSKEPGTLNLTNAQIEDLRAN